MAESLEKTIIFLACRLSSVESMLECECTLNRISDEQNEKLRKENADLKQQIADLQVLKIVNKGK